MTIAGTSRASDKIHVCQNESCVFSHRNKSEIFSKDMGVRQCFVLMILMAKPKGTAEAWSFSSSAFF